MKKRLIILILCLCLVLCALPISAGAESSCSFISINDTLPPELINCFIYYGGTIYVPIWLFASYGLGIFHAYHPDTNTAALYTGSAQLNFDLSSGKTYDDLGNNFNISGIMRSGTIYVPISYISSYFESFSYSTVSTPYGSILRLKDSRVVLTDAEFVKAANTLLKQYSAPYIKDDESNNPDDGNNPGSANEHEGSDVLLGLAGLPAETGLEVLQQYGAEACFFLTESQVRENPDAVRRLACMGYRLGVLWEGEGSFDTTSKLIFEVARVRCSLLTSLADDMEAARLAADGAGAVYFEPGIYGLYSTEDDFSPYNITAALEIADRDRNSLLLNCGEGMEELLGIVLNYITVNKFDLFAPSEILF